MRNLPHPTLHRSWVEIDLAAITDNVRAFLSLPGVKSVMPAIKADAYGHGALETARAALAGGASRLAVATCLEGQRLREGGIGVPIQILGACLPEEVRVAVKYNLTVSLHETYIADLVSIEAAKARTTIPIQFKIDTGMGRLGILPEKVVETARHVHSLPGLSFEGVFMHFADAADIEYSRWQLSRFASACRMLDGAGVTGFTRHAANSSGAVLHPEARFDLIRPGAGIYGYLSPDVLESRLPLAQAMSWHSTVIQIKDYPPGANLGYNRSFTTRRPTRVAVLPTGYADGYRRENSNRAMVLIRGMRCPVVGIVSMDYMMADVTEIDDLEVGAKATLLGENRGERIGTSELAIWSGTIPYCITTGVGARPGRLYINA